MAGTGTQGCPGSRAGTGANISPRFRAEARTDATSGARAGVWARESGVCVKIGFVDVTVSRLSVFKGVCTDLRATHWVLFHSVCTQS